MLKSNYPINRIVVLLNWNCCPIRPQFMCPSLVHSNFFELFQAVNLVFPKAVESRLRGADHIWRSNPAISWQIVSENVVDLHRVVLMVLKTPNPSECLRSCLALYHFLDPLHYQIACLQSALPHSLAIPHSMLTIRRLISTFLGREFWGKSERL